MIMSRISKALLFLFIGAVIGWNLKSWRVSHLQAKENQDQVIQVIETAKKDSEAANIYINELKKGNDDLQDAVDSLRDQLNRVRKQANKVPANPTATICNVQSQAEYAGTDKNKLAEVIEQFGIEQLRIAKESDDAIKQLGLAQSALEARE